MAFGVNSILGDLKRGTARSSHYEMLIAGEERLAFRTISISAPGRTVASTPSGVYGAIQEVGYGTIYSPVSAQIYCSPDHWERKYFTRWQDSIIGRHRTKNGNTVEADYDVGYYAEYTRSVNIKQYDEAGKETHEIGLREAYPKSVSDLSYSYLASELLVFTVTFQYRYFYEK